MLSNLFSMFFFCLSLNTDFIICDIYLTFIFSINVNSLLHICKEFFQIYSLKHLYIIKFLVFFFLFFFFQNRHSLCNSPCSGCPRKISVDKLALNSQILTCICLLSTVINDLCYYCPASVGLLRREF